MAFRAQGRALETFCVHLSVCLCIPSPFCGCYGLDLKSPPRDSVGDFVLKGLLSGGRGAFERWGPVGDLYIIGLCMPLKGSIDHLPLSFASWL